MTMISLFKTLVTSVVVAVVFRCNLSSSQTNVYFFPEISCPSVFRYAFLENKTIGIIKINGVRHGTTKIVVELSQPGAYDLGYFGKLSLNFDKEKTFDYINSGRELSYRVDFPLPHIIPKVTSITLNDELICSGLKYDPPSTIMKLEDILTTYPVNSLSNLRSGYWQQDSSNINKGISKPSPLETFDQPSPSSSYFYSFPLSLNEETSFNTQQNPDQYASNQQTPDFVSKLGVSSQKVTAVTPKANLSFFKAVETDLSSSPNHEALEYINSFCGQENVNFVIKRLNIKGSPITKSKFPWIAAVLRSINRSLTFQCGGSLISKRTVISSAHCFYSEYRILGPEDVLVSMGLHDLTELWNSYNMAVANVIIHPDYKHNLINFDADLAVVLLKQSVTFTTSIRPICLWQGSTDIRDIEGVSGAIVGWGSDGDRQTTGVPTLVNATIVSEITCIRSNELFISLPSNRTLCARNLDGSGPCTGDSGNGLMIKKRNKWMLRGTVSAAMGSPTRRCNLDQYAIFSDTGKFAEWIRLNMLL